MRHRRPGDELLMVNESDVSEMPMGRTTALIQTILQSSDVVLLVNAPCAVGCLGLLGLVGDRRHARLGHHRDAIAAARLWCRTRVHA